MRWCLHVGNRLSKQLKGRAGISNIACTLRRRIPPIVECVIQATNNGSGIDAVDVMAVPNALASAASSAAKMGRERQGARWACRREWIDACEEDVLTRVFHSREYQHLSGAFDFSVSRQVSGIHSFIDVSQQLCGRVSTWRLAFVLPWVE